MITEMQVVETVQGLICDAQYSIIGIMKRSFYTGIFIAFLACQSAFCADYYTLGKQAFQRQDYELANTYFVKAITQNPNDANMRYYYAQTLAYLKNYPQAIKEYGYVVQLAPNSVAANYSKQAITYLNTLMPAPTQNKTTPQMNNPGRNYAYKATTSTGDIAIWDIKNMPIKVYIDNSFNANSGYVDAAKNAFAAWRLASDGLLSFVIVNSPEQADMRVVFDGIAKKTENQILGLTQHTSANGYITKVTVTLYTFGPKYKPLTANDVYNVALHEFGHALGICGHSDNENDVMYAMYDVNKTKNKLTLSQMDKNTIKALYSIDRTASSNSTNSINRVLGSKEARLQNKLKQSLDYVKQTPTNAIGYVNVANTYKAMNNESEAIEYYKKALELDRNNKEANQALGQIYAAKNDLRSAEIYYRNLIRIEPKSSLSYCNLINLYIKNKRLDTARSLLSTLLYRNASAKNDACINNAMNFLGR